jgi:hypothetical protein
VSRRRIERLRLTEEDGMKRKAVSALALTLLILAATGDCENTDPVAPTDGTLLLSANPTALSIDPNSTVAPSCETVWNLRADVAAISPPPAAERCASSLVRAQVFDKSGKPATGVGVTFVPTAGWMNAVLFVGTVPAAAGATVRSLTVRTDSGGFANAYLTIFETEAAGLGNASPAVNAQSSTLTQKVSLTVSVGPENKPPRASVTAVPKDKQLVGQPVAFDGTGSQDPDGTITCFRWSILSDNPDDPTKPNPEIIQGSAESSIGRIFTNQQNLSVLLQVSDVAEATRPCDSGRPVPDSYFSPSAFTLPYQIVCANKAPVANAGPDQSQQGAPGTDWPVVLDGRASTDSDGFIVTYIWNCGNGTQALEILPGMVACYYRPGTYQATLTVLDNGVTQTAPYTCQATDDDTATVTITVPAQ